MKSPRKIITSAILAVAFLSAGAFAQSPDMVPSHADANVTVISKTVEAV